MANPRVAFGIRKIMPPTSRLTQFQLLSSATETDIITMAAKSATLKAGSTFKITIRGSVRNAATSGTLTFKVYIGANAAPQTFVLPTQTSSSSEKDFSLEATLVIRTDGASGTFVASAHSKVPLGGWFSIGSIVTGTSAVDTTADQTVKITAQWQTSNSANILTLETATIEQMM